ncbi:MAG: threonine synthase [Gammaproteobacteria bacterium]
MTVRFVSTRALDGDTCTASDAIVRGLAPDGGLFVPVNMPVQDWRPEHVESLPAVAARFMRPFFDGDPLRDSLADICAEAFNFPVTIEPVDGDALSVLELFHGPTAAFKDFGARFLAACFQRLEAAADAPLTILVATSGDTGGAVAAAFHQRPGVAVDVLFPHGQVSPRQAQQLTCWGDNIRAFCVDGPFDACQRLVKEAFVDPGLRERRRLSSANSINLGRLLPQAAYYVWASVRLAAQHQAPPSFIIPTGNLGNGLACVWAKRCGAPIGRIHFATNDNRSVPEFFSGTDWTPRASVTTLANAMDVGNPSNMERLRAMFGDDDVVRASASASAIDDAAIREQIAHDDKTRDQVFCPHTATAMHAFDHHVTAGAKEQGPWVVVATAHPAKFESVVEPLIGRAIDVPANLQALLDKPSHSIRLSAQLDAFLQHFPG